MESIDNVVSEGNTENNPSSEHLSDVAGYSLVSVASAAASAVSIRFSSLIMDNLYFHSQEDTLGRMIMAGGLDLAGTAAGLIALVFGYKAVRSMYNNQ